VSGTHILTGEHSRLRRWTLYIFARYVERPLLAWGYWLLQGQYRRWGQNRLVQAALGWLVAAPFGYLGDTARPVPYPEVLRMIADDQPQVRSALMLLLRQEPDVTVVGEADDAAQVLELATGQRPDLVLLDWELPGARAVADSAGSGRRLLPALRACCPSLKVIALSGRPEARQAALTAGVDAFVSKGDPPERLLAAVNGCRRGSCE
jgi:CheY-like chemotaxis protein